MCLWEEDVVVNQDPATHVHLSRDDDLSSMDDLMFEEGAPSNQRLVIRCTGMPTQSSALSRLQRILLEPQFTDVTILLSNGISQLPLDVFSTVFASKHSIERLQLLVSGRTTSVDGLVALLGCWKGAERDVPRLVVGCTWHHPRPAAQWERLNHALLQLEDSKIGILELEKTTLRVLPRVRSLALSLSQTTMLPQPYEPTRSLVLQPLPQAVPGIVQWLKAGALPHRLGLDVYRLSPEQMQDMLEAVVQQGSSNKTTLALLGIRHTDHMETLVAMLPQLHVQHLEVEYMDHAYMRHQWPTDKLVEAVHTNWHLPALTLRRRTVVSKDPSPPPILDAKQRAALEQALARNHTVSTTTTPASHLLGHYLRVCPDVSLATTWLLHAEPMGQVL